MKKWFNILALILLTLLDSKSVAEELNKQMGLEI